MSGPGTREFDDLLHCMICFEQFRTPKMLNCGHTFCADCLQGYLQTYQQQRRAVPGKLPCPTCRDLTPLPHTGITGLKNDFKVHKIEEMFRTANLREYRALKAGCDPCRSQKKQAKGRYFCGSCSMSYCDQCLVRHNNNPVFKDHDIIDRQSNASSEVFCKVHRNEQVKYFCRACEMVVCTLCIMTQHEGHDVMEITSMFKRHQEEIRNLQTSVQGRVQRLRNKGVEIERLRLLNIRAGQQAEIAIKEKSRDMIAAIQDQQEELLQELKQKRDEKLKQLMKELDSVNFHVARACSLNEFAGTTARKNSLKLMAIHEELIQRMKTVGDPDSHAAGPDSPYQAVVTYFPPLAEATLGRIGEIQGTADELKEHPAVGPPGDSRPRTRSNGSSVSRSVTSLGGSRPKLLFAVTKQGNNIGEIRDPLGVASLLNGDIVVSEWGNKRIQIFDTVGKSINIIGMGHIGPQGVAITLKGNIIVTDAQNKRLQVFTSTGDQLAKWGLGKFFAPCGVAICPNGNCVVSDIAEHTVSIYQGEKKCIKRFGARGNRPDQFHNPLYVTSGHNSEIFVSDSDNHCIKVFDNIGNFVRKFGSTGNSDGQMKYPRGICVDEDGNILVADRNNDRVTLYTPLGGFIRHVLTRDDGLRDPYAIAVTNTRNIIVTESGSKRASLKLFQLN